MYDTTDIDSSVMIGVGKQGTIVLAKNHVHQQRPKHIYVRYHFPRADVSDGVIKLSYVPSNELKCS